MSVLFLSPDLAPRAGANDQNGGIGSAAEFEVQYRAHVIGVRGFLARQRCAPVALDDLTQEVFLRAWAGRHGFTRKASISTWLLAIAHNVAREWRRRELHQPISRDDLNPHVDDTVSQTVDSREQTLIIHEALAKLTPKQQHAVRLTYATDAVPAADCSGPALRRRLADARAHLRQLLGPSTHSNPRQ